MIGNLLKIQEELKAPKGQYNSPQALLLPFGSVCTTYS